MSDLAILALSSFKERGESVEKYIRERRKTPSKKYLIDLTQTRFSNGEAKIMLNESVRDKDVYILADVCNYGCTYTMFGSENRMSPDDHFQDIKRAVSAASWRANRITVIMPFLYAGRQHRRMGRESLDCAIALQELEKMGVDRIITFDAHDPNIINAVPLSAFDNMTPISAIMTKFIEDSKNPVDDSNTIVISPDYGAMGRSVKVATVLGLPVGIVYKRRDYSKVVRGKNPILGFAYTGPSVKGKSAIIVDDMIASGGSILEVASYLKKQGVGEITIFTSFALFNDGTAEFDRLHKEGIIKKVYATNLSYVSAELKDKEWFERVNLTKEIAEMIDILNTHGSVGRFINDFSAVEMAKAKWNRG